MRLNLVLSTLAVFALALCPEVIRAAEYPVYPLPRVMELTGGQLDLSGASIEYTNGPVKDLEALAAGLSRELATRDRLAVVWRRAEPFTTPTAKIVLGLASDPDVVKLLPQSSPDTAWNAPEGYRVSVDGQRAVIVGHDLSGLYYGIQSFVQLVTSGPSGQVHARGAQIADRPLAPIRGVHVYLPAREDIPFFKNYIRTMAANKINTLILEVGGGMRLDRHPEINLAWEHFCRSFYDMGDPTLRYGEQVPLGPQGRFQASVHTELAGGSWLTKDEVRDIVACARENHMNVVPEIQSLTHSYYLVLAHRDIAEIPEADWPDSYDPSNPKSYELLFDVIDEYLDVIRPEWVHIGHDEWRTGTKGVPGANYGNDVMKIYHHLQSRGVKSMMWADHLVKGHNMEGKIPEPPTKPGEVWYAYPSTMEAPDIIEAGAKDILMLNWSWAFVPSSYEQLSGRGWKQILGNFGAEREYDQWRQRFSGDNLLGAEMSTWCRADEASYGQNGAILNMLLSENVLWSVHTPSLEELYGILARRMGEVRQSLSGKSLPSQDTRSGRPGYKFVSLNLAGKANSSLGQTGGKLPARVECNGLPFATVAGGQAVSASGAGREVRGIPVGTNAASLIFLQVASRKGSNGNTYKSNYPVDTAELLGFYRVHYEDGLEEMVPIHYGRNISHFEGSYAGQVYFGETCDLGRGSDGKPVLATAYEWVCPRPNRKIASVDLVGVNVKSNAAPLLLGLTVVKPPFTE